MSQESLSLETLKRLVPLGGLRPESLQQILRRTEILSEKTGKHLFDRGSNNSDSIYLLEGEVQLLDAESKVLKTLVGGTPDSLHRVAHQIPRTCTARCATPVRYIRIDSSLLDVMLTWDQTGNFEVGELNQSSDDETEDSEGGDWMTRLLQMKAFQRVPPANLQAMFMRLEELHVKPGDKVIQQGAEGDFFYVMISGKAMVTREMPNAKPMKLAELASGACFGEEALISNDRRNASVTMLSNGTLMRLAKKDFDDLLNAPLARKLDRGQAEELIGAGRAVWLDVRLPSEFKNAHIDKAQNLPLYMLRPRLGTLKKDVTYIVYCDSEARSSVAAFVLTQKGYEAYILKDGFQPD